MDYVPPIGAVCLGIFIAWLTGFFIRRLEKYTAKAFSGFVGVLIGAGVLKIFETNMIILWFYPIGLVIGLAMYIVIALALGAPPDSVAFGKINWPWQKTKKK